MTKMTEPDSYNDGQRRKLEEERKYHLHEVIRRKVKEVKSRAERGKRSS